VSLEFQSRPLTSAPSPTSCTSGDEIVETRADSRRGLGEGVYAAAACVIAAVWLTRLSSPTALSSPAW
jgi:hypothetical protein